MVMEVIADKASGGKVRHSSDATKSKRFEGNSSSLFQLIEEEKWDTAILRLQETAGVAEARKWAFERKDMELTMRRLPIHEACIHDPGLPIIKALLKAFPEGAKARDLYGRLPLHHASIYNASLEVVSELLGAYPEALDIQDNWGKTPLENLKVGANPDKRIIEALEKRPSDFLKAKHSAEIDEILRDAEERQAKSDEMISKMESELQKVKGCLEESISREVSLRQELSKIKNEGSGESESFEEEKRKILVDAAAKEDELKQEMEGMECQIDELKAEINRLESENLRSDAKPDETAEELQKVTKKLEESLIRELSFRNELYEEKSRTPETASLGEEYSANSETAEKVESMQHEIDKLKKEVDELKAEKTSMESAAKEQQRKSDELSKMLGVVKTFLQESLMREKSLQDELLKGRKEEGASLEEEKEPLKEGVATREEELQQEIIGLKRQVIGMQTEIETLESAAENQKMLSHGMVSELEKELHMVKKSLQERIAKEHSLKQEISEEKKKEEASLQEENKYIKILATLKEREMQQEINSLKDQLGELKEMLTSSDLPNSESTQVPKAFPDPSGLLEDAESERVVEEIMSNALPDPSGLLEDTESEHVVQEILSKTLPDPSGMVEVAERGGVAHRVKEMLVPPSSSLCHEVYMPNALPDPTGLLEGTESGEVEKVKRSSEEVTRLKESMKRELEELKLQFLEQDEEQRKSVKDITTFIESKLHKSSDFSTEQLEGFYTQPYTP